MKTPSPFSICINPHFKHIHLFQGKYFSLILAIILIISSCRKRGNKDVEDGTSDVNREVQVNDKERDDEGISKMDDRDKVKDDDDSDSDSSSDKEVDIGRGEGDLMSSSDEEDDEGLDFQKAEVGSHIVMQGLHLSLLCAKAF